MFSIRSLLFLVLIGATVLPIRCNKVYLSQFTSNSWGTPTGNMCFSNTVRAYGTSQTMSIVTGVSFRSVRFRSANNAMSIFHLSDKHQLHSLLEWIFAAPDHFQLDCRRSWNHVCHDSAPFQLQETQRGMRSYVRLVSFIKTKCVHDPPLCCTQYKTPIRITIS